jgi:thiopurine S-methyltransferase
VDNNYWLGRWERGETGWHQREVEPLLIAHYSNLAPCRVFVPLCGKSLDLAWLASRGHQVIGVEASELACRTFFEENNLPFQTNASGAFTLFTGGRVSIFQGDFFELSPKELGPIDAIYDRAALIALPPDVRSKYAEHMKTLIRQCVPKRDSFQFLQIVLERTPHDSNGPPFSIPLDEVASLYGNAFNIQPLSRNHVEMDESKPANVDECAYLLKPLDGSTEQKAS